jgi:hypothetical protein
MQENQWPQNPVLTFWQSKRICSDNARQGHLNFLPEIFVDRGVKPVAFSTRSSLGRFSVCTKLGVSMSAPHRAAGPMFCVVPHRLP